MVRDLMQAGEGIPQGGVSLPYSGAASAINRPGTDPAVTFPVAYTTLPAITPGYLAGQFATSLNPSTGATLTGVRTDIINIIYADNILQDTGGKLSLQLSHHPSHESALCAGPSMLPARRSRSRQAVSSCRERPIQLPPAI